MFNQLPATDAIAAIGRTARDAARAEGALSEFDRGQLLSAYSATRHLAVEVTAYEEALRRFAAAVGLPGSLSRIELAERTCELLEGAAAPAVRGALRELVDREVSLLAEAIEG
jgi:hypothetical protein